MSFQTEQVSHYRYPDDQIYINNIMLLHSIDFFYERILLYYALNNEYVYPVKCAFCCLCLLHYLGHVWSFGDLLLVKCLSSCIFVYYEAGAAVPFEDPYGVTTV